MQSYDDKKQKLLKTLDRNGWLYELGGRYSRCKPSVDIDSEEGTYDCITINEDYISFEFDSHLNSKTGAILRGDCKFEYLVVGFNILKMELPWIDLEILL